MKKALFLDRDGVINKMVKYRSDWDSPRKSEDVKLVGGIEKVISWANKNRVLVIEVSNQPGVAKGKMDQKTSEAIEKKVRQLLKEKGAVIDRAYICPHHPEAIIPKLKKICDCRKPKSGLLFKAAAQLGIDLEKSIILGDKASDIKAGRISGCKTIIFIHSNDMKDKVEEAKKAKADYMVSEILEAVPLLKKIFKLEDPMLGKDF